MDAIHHRTPRTQPAILITVPSVGPLRTTVIADNEHDELRLRGLAAMARGIIEAALRRRD